MRTSFALGGATWMSSRVRSCPAAQATAALQVMVLPCVCEEVILCVSCGGGDVVVRSAKPKKDSQLATRRTSCGFHSINTFIVNMLAYIATLLVVRDVIPNEESDSVPVQVRACHPHSDEIWSRLLADLRDRGGALSGILVGAGSCSLLISRLYKSIEVVERRSTGISNRLPTHQKSCLSKTLFAKLQ